MTQSVCPVCENALHDAECQVCKNRNRMEEVTNTPILRVVTPDREYTPVRPDGLVGRQRKKLHY